VREDESRNLSNTMEAGTQQCKQRGEPKRKLRVRATEDIDKENILNCSVYSCSYATIARRNMLFLVTAGKHVNNSQAIAR
jgi:hypothetical protein